MATTSRTLADVAPDALAAIRRLLRAQDAAAGGIVETTPREMLTRLGVLLPDGQLTAAGALFFCPSPRTVIELAVFDVPAGNLIAGPGDFAGLSLVEQLAEVEARLDAHDTSVVLPHGFALSSVRQVPWPAVREALLNAVVHRDWLPQEPIRVTWTQADGSLDVVSPGGSPVVSRPTRCSQPGTPATRRWRTWPVPWGWWRSRGSAWIGCTGRW